MSIQLAAIVVSGVIGLWFVHHYSKIILMLLGGYYIYVLLNNYVAINRKIEILIKEMEKMI